MSARRARRARRRPQGVPAGRRPRRAASSSSPPRSPRSSTQTRRVQFIENDEIVALTPDGVRFLTADGRADRARDLRGRLGRGDRREGRLRDLHAQGDPRAGRRRRRDDRRPHAPRATASTSATSARSTTRCCATSAADRSSSPAAPATTRASSAATRSSSGRACRSRWTSPPSTATATRLSGEGDLVVGISQSGETADTLAAMRLARERGAKVLAITNIMGSQATRDSDGVLYTRAGLEIGVAATKTFVAQVAAMYLLGLRIAELRGTLDAGAPHRRSCQGLKALPHAGRARHRGGRAAPSRRSPTSTSGPSSSSTSAATSACRWRSRARSSSRRSPTSPPTRTRPAR